MWGTKKNNGDTDVEEHSHPHEDTLRASRDVEPTERSRLLAGQPPPGPRADGYLDPDDPAVSPYNLWTVRFIRFVTVTFAMITFVWWVLLFVSIFVSPPYLNTRGSGFTDFAYTTLTIGVLLVALLFFSGPSKALRITIGIIALLLLVDMVIIVSVKRMRQEEGWVGIASVVWAVLMAAWCILTDQVVAWGKREEEQRLTGRAETKRSIKEWLGVLLSTAITVVYIIIVVLLTATLVLRCLDAGVELDGHRYPVDGDKYSVHFACVSRNDSSNHLLVDSSASRNHHNHSRLPTVLLESGEYPTEGGFEGWVYSAMQNGTIDRYCYWDRPGYAWSDNAPSPHSAGMSADALSQAVAFAGEQGPWILVSAGYGSIVSRIFAARHNRDIVGVLMVDPLHEDLLPRIGNAARGFQTWGWGILSPLGVRRIIGALFYGRTKEDRVFGRNVGETGKYLKARLQENLVAESLTRSEIVAARDILSPKTPLVIVSSGLRTRTDEQWEEKQRDLTKVTDNLVSWDVVQKAPHEVWTTAEGKAVLGARLKDLVKKAT